MRPQRRHIIKISLTALAIVSAITLVISIVLLVNNIRLLGMAEHWILLGSLLVLLLLVGYWLWRQCHGEGWPVRILSTLLWCSGLVIYLVVAFFVITLSDKQIARNGPYIVYHEPGNIIINIDDRPMVLYKRYGLREQRLFTVGFELSEPHEPTLIIDEEHDLVTFSGHVEFDDWGWSFRNKYRLSNGQLIENKIIHNSIDKQIPSTDLP